MTVAAALGISIAIPATSFADLAGGCDFSPANNGTPGCLGPLTGSMFAGGDGNLQASPTNFGSTDWQNVAGLNPGFDLPSGTGDNSFGQGTKEDNPNVTVVNGSIPNNKSDLTRFYEASEFSTVNNHNFLYLGWERANRLGTANIDFEINQKTTTGFTGSTSGPVTLNRTAGDLLVTFDFTNGGGTPTIGLLRWLTSATTPSGVPGYTTNVCYSAKSFPCWGDELTLHGDEAIGAVNNLDPVNDPLFSTDPNYQNPVPALQFGETAIDLTQAGVFPPGTCEAFGSAFVKSRASASFTAEVKDFIAPIKVNISNCGQVTIIKHTDPGGINQNFSYTSTLPTPTGTPPPPTTPDCELNTTPTPTFDPTPSSFTLNDSAANTEDCTNVPAGSYTVTEGTEPANFKLESLTCTDNGIAGSSGSQNSTNPFEADIAITPGGHVTCTYVNQQQLGAIKITKTGKDKNCTAANTPPISNGVCTGASTADLSGAVFSVKDSGGNAVAGSPATTGSDGTVCIGNLPFGTYSVQETTAPNGYAIDNTAAQNVTVSTNSTCGDGNEAAFTASDTPLTNLTVNAASQVAGATNSTITCLNSSNENIGNSPVGPVDPAKVTANNLKTGTYTCTVVIDP